MLIPNPKKPKGVGDRDDGEDDREHTYRLQINGRELNVGLERKGKATERSGVKWI
jgi:hypothetical protein